jgi:hypothetical protein
MKEKKLFKFLLESILILIFLAYGSISCQADWFGTDDTPGAEESGGNVAGSEPQVEEEKESVEIEKEEIIPVKVWIEEEVPSDMGFEVKSRLSGTFDKIEIVDKKEDSDVWIEINMDSSNSVGTFVMAPVASFFGTPDNISYNDFIKFWGGEEGTLDYLSSDGSEPGLVLTGEVYGVLKKILGESGNSNIKIVSEEELLLRIENDNIFSIVPFDDILKKYRVLNLDNMSVFDKGLDIRDYPLAANISFESINPDMERKIAGYCGGNFFTNRNTEKITSVIMTGVTALARGKTIGRRMDEHGVLYPAEKIVDVLIDADITHISNEICFVEGCSNENRFPYLCSSPEYIELLEYIETDVIELTGNHMNDYGPEWMLKTLDMYDERGWPYFGGGRNLEESYRPALFEINGNKIAFLGVNSYGLANINEWAGEDSPGAAKLNIWDEAEKKEDFEIVEEIIKELKSQGYLVIFTFQYQESEQYSPTESQIADFRRIIDSGADIVSGSQSHWPMGVEFRGRGFINYGLGNIFYNMRDITGLKQGIIAKHIFYEGRHINTIMITTMLENLSQPRLTTPEEREELLNSIFGGSIR